MAQRVKAGDVFVCYLTRLSRWFGLLEVIEGPFINDKPIFVPENDPFVVRFRVHTAVWLDIEKAIPIHDDAIWTGLSFTHGLPKGSLGWTGKSSRAQNETQDSPSMRITDSWAKVFL
jgi:hypothetical protein